MTSRRIAAVDVLGPLGMVFALVCSLVVGSAGRGEAATITVNTFEQVNDLLCTLADAIDSANLDTNVGGCVRVGAGGPDTVVLPTGTYPLTVSNNGSGADLTGLPVVITDITILGNGSTIARTNGNNAPFFRIFTVTAGTLTLVELTVSGGLIRSPSGFEQGGGIRVFDTGSLTLNTVTISGNAVDVSAPLLSGEFATNGGDSGGVGFGGGISFESFQSTGGLALTDTNVVGNSVVSLGGPGGGQGGFGQGGGISVVGLTPVTFTRGSVANNIVNTDAGPGTFGGGAQGGGIFVSTLIFGAGGLALTSVTISGNTVSAVGAGTGDGGTAFGGGVFYQKGGPLQANGFPAQGSPALAGGLTVSDCTFSGNSAIANGGSGKSGGDAGGGGLYYEAAVDSFGSVSIQRSAFLLNTAQADGGTNGPSANGGAAEGGAIYYKALASDGNLEVVGVTATGNSATARAGTSGFAGLAMGGAISFESEGGVLSVTNATVTGNSVIAPGSKELGGGIGIGSTALLQNSIVIGNTGPADCSGNNFTSLGNNIIPLGGGCGAPLGSDKIGVDPLLGALVDLGRPAGQYLPPQPTSPAIDGANPAACPATDQVGQSRTGTCDIGAVEVVPGTLAVASILPSTRAGVLGTKLTAFVSVINTSATTAFKVGIELTTAVPALFAYQTTDAQNVPTGAPNTPVDIPAGGVQTYVIVVTPTGAFDPTELIFAYKGTNTAPVTVIIGLNTLLVSASLTPIPDLVALIATLGNNGIVDIPSTTQIGVFTMATVNLGAGDLITVTADTGSAVLLPLTVLVCQTDAGGTCLAPAGASVTTQINGGETPTFGFFPVATGFIPFDPANNRIFVRLKDSGGATRGGSSVAPRTVP